MAEQQAAQAEAASKLSDWRLSLSMDKIKSFRKKFETVGHSDPDSQDR
jgi:hypothetical protein